jgi:glycosyltransferase involved in cell wall biosynthesis
MRIVIAHSQLRGFGGGERAVLELLRRIGRRHDVELWAGGYVPSETYPELATYPRRDLTRREWRTARPESDAVVAHSFGARLLAFHHPRVVSYLHTLRSPYLRPGPRPTWIARKRLDVRAVRRAAALATNSAFASRVVRRIYGRAAEVVPPGVDERLFAMAERTGDYALYVGRLSPEKGLERLLAWSKSLDMDLVIVGTGEPAYERRLRRLAGARVRFRGALDGPALDEAYAGSRFLAFTPRDEEFGLAALEAMAAAKPVVATAEGGLPELVREGETGFLAANAEQFRAASERLLASDALCRELGREGRRQARAYSWDRFANRIIEMCEQAKAPL